jgi:polysaccharide export outer membrane protein
MKLILPLFISIVACAQSRSPVPETPSANLPAQKIGNNDLIAVAVYNSPEFTRTIRVGDDGQIRFPMLKRQIGATGLLPDQLEKSIRAAIAAENLIIDPFVTVIVVEYYSRPISVAGAVRRPISFQAITPVTLLDALTRAEGLSPDAGPDILVSRKQKEGGAFLVQRIPVKGLIDAADPELNLSLTGGEEVRVPEVGKVYVVGNVKRPGAFRVEGASGTTVLKTMALAEGLAPYAAKQAFLYRREAGSGGKNEITIELKDILDRKSPDVPLEADDILYIPDNARRRMTLGALEKLIGFGGATASGMLIWGFR